jgi:hypothetical protein
MVRRRSGHAVLGESAAVELADDRQAMFRVDRDRVTGREHDVTDHAALAATRRRA